MSVSIVFEQPNTQNPLLIMRATIETNSSDKPDDEFHVGIWCRFAIENLKSADLTLLTWHATSRIKFFNVKKIFKFC
jgi:hypothetical protein